MYVYTQKIIVHPFCMCLREWVLFTSTSEKLWCIYTGKRESEIFLRFFTLALLGVNAKLDSVGTHLLSFSLSRSDQYKLTLKLNCE